MTDELGPRLGEVIGPCYTADAMCRETGMSPAGLDAAVRELRVLRLVSSDSVDLYPAFQVRDHTPLPHLDAVLSLLREGIDSPWAWVLWLAGQAPGNPLSRIEQLAAGEAEDVIADAGRTVWSWAP